MSKYIKVFTKRCVRCQDQGVITVWEDDWNRYLNGALVQDAFPDLIAPIREQIVSGTHPKCWEELFADEVITWETGRPQGETEDKGKW